MTVQISTKVNRSHLVCGETALILPTRGRTEKDIQASGPQWISVEDSTCSVHSSRGPLEPASPYLKSEVEIVCRIAEATIGDRHGIAWQAMRDDYSVIRTHISRVVPGCESYEVNVHRPGRFRVAASAAGFPDVRNQSGRAEFVASPIEVLQVPEGHLVLQTLRSHDQFNTTIYGLSDRYRGIEGGRRVIFLHADDITHLGFGNGDFVDISTHWTEDDRETMRQAIPDRRVRHAAGISRCVLPGDESVGAAGLHRARQQHARRRSRSSSNCYPPAVGRRVATAPAASIPPEGPTSPSRNHTTCPDEHNLKPEPLYQL